MLGLALTPSQAAAPTAPVEATCVCVQVPLHKHWPAMRHMLLFSKPFHTWPPARQGSVHNALHDKGFTGWRRACSWRASVLTQRLRAGQVTMANFPQLLQLTRLELGATDVDYAGLVAIGALSSLQRLSLTDCQVSRATATILQNGTQVPGGNINLLQDLLLLMSHGCAG